MLENEPKTLVMVTSDGGGVKSLISLNTINSNCRIESDDARKAEGVVDVSKNSTTKTITRIVDEEGCSEGCRDG